jgi:hypothetical protein
MRMVCRRHISHTLIVVWADTTFSSIKYMNQLHCRLNKSLKQHLQKKSIIISLRIHFYF